MPLEWRNLSDPVDREVFIKSVRQNDANNAALAKLCLEKSGDTLQHVGTATVVRDIISMSNAILGEGHIINFWGFSYGTVIGSYLVNMFPERVGRVIIDGVVDSELWANSWSKEWYKYDYIDTEKAFENFLSACEFAGPGRCALADGKSTARSIGQAIDNFLDRLYDYPLPVTNANRPGILTSGMVKGATFRAMYAPRNWPLLAEQFAQAMRGNGTGFMNDILMDIEVNTTVKPQTAQAITAVTCVDTPAYSDAVDNSKICCSRSDLCHHWSPREVERFTGPFNLSLSNSILIIGNTADPITPVINAKRVNELLKDSSRLLIQDGSGHCSTAMASLCTGKVIRGYLVNGKLPPNGIVCSTSEQLFPSTMNSSGYVQNPDDWPILEKIQTLGEAIQLFLMRRK